MNHSDIIVIGGGAAGLMAAYTLSKAGRQVTILEARDRLGGRIHTLDNSGFTKPAEAGAEFIHGDLPVTLGLLKEAKIAYTETKGEIWRHKDQQLIKAEDFMEQGDLVMTRLQELKEDITIAAFLEQYFSDKQYEDLRNSIRGFVEGYDAADIGKASAFALREEWEGEDQPQYRPAGGYVKLIAFMEDACKRNGCRILLQVVVKEVQWKAGTVELQTEQDHFTADRLIVTIPLNVFKARLPEKGAIAFVPALTEKLQASEQMGAGSVIKILLEFSTPVWQDLLVQQSTGADLSKAAWIFSGEPVPTWWTQLPVRSNLLTGWIAGPKAEALAGASNEDILESSLQSLGTIFSLPLAYLKQQLKASQVINWSSDPFARGAYAYNTVQTAEARKILLQPVDDTLYFAGEALYEGPEMGTVEGALCSGKRAADELLKKV